MSTKRLSGEKHLPLITEEGYKGFYNFCGPGTKLKERLARGDKGVNKLDRGCRWHDQFYEEFKSMDDRIDSDRALIDLANNIENDPNEPRYEKRDSKLVKNLVSFAPVAYKFVSGGNVDKDKNKNKNILSNIMSDKEFEATEYLGCKFVMSKGDYNRIIETGTLIVEPDFMEVELALTPEQFESMTNQLRDGRTAVVHLFDSQVEGAKNGGFIGSLLAGLLPAVVPLAGKLIGGLFGGNKQSPPKGRPPGPVPGITPGYTGEAVMGGCCNLCLKNGSGLKRIVDEVAMHYDELPDHLKKCIDNKDGDGLIGNIIGKPDLLPEKVRRIPVIGKILGLFV